MAEESVPQWKRELIERRRAHGRAASVGPLQLTCPGVVTAVRHPELSQGMRFPTTVPDIQHLITQIEADRRSKMGEEKTKKLAPQEAGFQTGGGDEDNLSDSSEEFKYGPGIVSKLKNKYLSLTLRESHAKIRPSLANMRRATSLENILDEEKPEENKQPKFIKNPSATQHVPAQSRRGISRSRENMKRARSVEALMRYNRSVSADSIKDQVDDEFTEVDVEKSRNRISLEERELPPPDLVKQTLKLFEPYNPSSKPLPPPKSLAAVKTLAPKPVISPKPASIEVASVDNKERIPNGHSELRIDTKVRFRHHDIGSPLSEPSPPPKEPKTIPVAVEIVEKESAKNSHERPVIKMLHNDKLKKDDVDNCKPKSLFTKDWSPINKDRSEIKERFPMLPERPPTLKNRTSDINERSPSLTDWSPAGKDRPPFFPERTPPHLELKKTKEIEASEKHSLPSPKPRTLPRVADRKPVAAPPPPPESRRPLSPVTSRPLTETVSSPASPQMKQVGVIRPIVTQKSPPQHHPQKSHSDRELEKNLLNKVKSVEQPVTKVIVSLKQSPEECTVAPPKTLEEKKATSWSQKPNTMVFNFSHRKDVPDYIENDGLILGRRERPKIGDPGIILLPGGTDDFSTDFDGDDLMLDPPSPCDIVFIGDNVLINGKSNLQKAPKRTKMHIKFNEEAPKLFEYPSEASLLDDLSFDNADGTSTSPGLNLPLKSTSLASYTPSKVAMGSDFQLGVTRTQPPPQPSSRPLELVSSDEEDYLRPADEASTVAWSAETAADLLF